MNKTEPFTLSDFRRELADMMRPEIATQIAASLAKLDNPIHLAGNDRTCHQILGIIDAMTSSERQGATSLNHDRIARIARGAGVVQRAVTRLLQYQAEMVKMRNRATRGRPPSRQ